MQVAEYLQRFNKQYKPLEASQYLVVDFRSVRDPPYEIEVKSDHLWIVVYDLGKSELELTTYENNTKKSPKKFRLVIDSPSVTDGL